MSDREAFVARYAAGRSFADVGCMWNVHGAIAFAAERAGATRVTGVDVMPPTPTFAERQRTSSVRFVHGDLHDPAVMDAVGPHEVVWCSGVLYHAPHPILTLERLRQITTRTLLLGTEVLPLPGRLAAFAPPRWVHPGRPQRFDPDAAYGNWYWLPTPATVRSLLAATGFEIVEERRGGRGFNRIFVCAAPGPTAD